MSVFTRCISVFLLLVFTRVLVPDALVLALHDHTHTTEKKASHKPGGQLLDVKHNHCHTDQLFNNSYYTLASTIELPFIFTHLSTYLRVYGAVWKFTFPNNTCLRGPPQSLSSLA